MIYKLFKSFLRSLVVISNNAHARARTGEHDDREGAREPGGARSGHGRTATPPRSTWFWSDQREGQRTSHTAVHSSSESERQVSTSGSNDKHSAPYQVLPEMTPEQF